MDEEEEKEHGWSKARDTICSEEDSHIPKRPET